MEDISDDTEKQIQCVPQWKTKKMYVIALLSWTMGINNVMHTPDLFLKGNILDYTITYIPLVIFMGIPLTFMELGISQYTNRSLNSWNICPLFRGIGYSKIWVISIFQICYNVLNSYVLLYTFSSFSKSVRWNTCDSSWANTSCYNYNINISIEQRKYYQTSAEQFWYNGILSFKEDSNTLDTLQGESLLYFSLNMLIIFVINCGGTKSLQNVLPYTTIISSIGLILLACVTISTPGSILGLNQILNMEIHIHSLLPWGQNSMAMDAFCNILYSSGLGLGGLSFLGTQSSFRRPVHAYAILLNLINFGVTIIYGIIIFNFYGILSHHTKIRMEEILSKENKFGNNLFTVIPSAIMYLPGAPQIWIFLFYLSIFFKGLNSSALMASTVLQNIYEIRPSLKAKSVACSFACCLFFYLIGLILHTNLGIIICTYIKEIIYTTISPLINSFQIVAIVYFYGLANLLEDLHFMLGFEPSVYWKFCLAGSSLLLPVLTVLSIKMFSMEDYYTKFYFVTVLHYCVLCTVLVWIPYMAILTLIQKRTTKTVLEASKFHIPHVSIAVQKSRKLFSNQALTFEYIYEKHLLKKKLKKYED